MSDSNPLQHMPDRAPENDSVDDEFRFAFGENWCRFLELLDDDRIAEAERSIRATLGEDSLAGLSFLDAGSGSGLFSLAAIRLGAERVVSFDFDDESVACTAELRRRYHPDGDRWMIGQGSLLDERYLYELGSFDLVYSWGVLHHTGDMWRALGNVDRLVKPGGRLLISIYNDQGFKSRLWRIVKQIFNRVPAHLRPLLVVATMVPREIYSAVLMLAQGLGARYFRSLLDYRRSRGMSLWRDWVDWVGGYPFEVAKPDEVFRFYRERGYVLLELKTCAGGLGCNEFLFRKERSG
jgi:SAM-dependent methyltransferase